MSPRPRLLLLTSLAVPFLALGVWLPGLRYVAIIFNLVIAAIAIADWMISVSLKQVTVAREVSNVLSVGTRNPVRFVLRNRSSSPMTLQLQDGFPQPGQVTGLPLTLDLLPGKEVWGDYHFEPHRRGRAEFSGISLRTISRLGLWTFQEERDVRSPVRILPDIRSVYRYELMARQNRLEELGIKIRRLRGRGSNFERLRDYRREDEPRHIDWKATARNQKLISREFTVERNQNVIVAVDCGRSMLNESDGVSYLDHALNASIMLSYIALGQGDNVGFVAFSNRIERFVKAVRGKPAIQTVLQQAFDLEARRGTSDYTLLAEQLSRRCRKRSLVVLLTHVIDEQHLEAICEALRTVRSPHLFLGIFLRDLGLTTLAVTPPESDVGAFQCAAAAELLTAVERKLAALKEQGVLTLSTFPNQLTSDAINGYLDIKARDLI